MRRRPGGGGGRGDEKTRTWISSTQLDIDENTRQDPESCEVNFMTKKRGKDEILDLVQ